MYTAVHHHTWPPLRTCKASDIAPFNR